MNFIKNLITRLRSIEYLVSYAMYFKDSCEYVIFNITFTHCGKVTTKTIEEIQNKALENSSNYSHCFVVALSKL